MHRELYIGNVPESMHGAPRAREGGGGGVKGVFDPP
jgi:hypothetical protein